MSKSRRVRLVRATTNTVTLREYIERILAERETALRLAAEQRDKAIELAARQQALIVGVISTAVTLGTSLAVAAITIGVTLYLRGHP